MTTIDGIPCTIRSRRIQDAIRRVFAGIQRHPRDWARLRRHVQRIEWLPKGEDSVGDGRWWPDVAHHAGDDDVVLHLFRTRGCVQLSRRVCRMPNDHVLGILAHEYGHAVTRASDWSAREGDGISSHGWILEMCADKYAFKWGFEKKVRALPPRPLHHSVLPGEVVWVDDRAFRVDRHFIIRAYPRLDGQAPAVPGLP
jgi:hypothetical protein